MRPSGLQAQASPDILDLDEFHVGLGELIVGVFRERRLERVVHDLGHGEGRDGGHIGVLGDRAPGALAESRASPDHRVAGDGQWLLVADRGWRGVVA